MSVIFYSILGLASLWLFFYVFTVYNGMIALHHQVEKAWYNIDVLLNQRHDEITALVKVCRLYLEYEQLTLTESLCHNYQKACSISEKIDIETQINGGIEQIRDRSENYPALAADTTFRFLSGRLRELEDRIADQRALYNNYVENYNRRVSRFPDRLIAVSFGYRKAIYFYLRDKSCWVSNISFPS